MQSTLSAGVISLEISSRNARVQALQARWNLLHQVFAERAAHYRAGGDDEYDKAIPGGTTGLLVKDFKGKDADRPVYKIDTATLAELRAIEKQAAEELGQWTEKQVPLGSAAVRTSITVRFIKAGPPDDLGRYIPADSPHQVVKLIETTGERST